MVVKWPEDRPRDVILGYNMIFRPVSTMLIMKALDSSGINGDSWNMIFVLWSIQLEFRTWKFGTGHLELESLFSVIRILDNGLVLCLQSTSNGNCLSGLGHLELFQEIQ